MRAVLVRHARAGKRAEWTGDDRLRPLDERGRRQAAGLVAPLAGLGVDRLVSSPYVRCVETLVPIADSLGLTVEERDELAEGASVEAVRRLLDEVGAHTPALCTHGDVVEALLGDDRGLRKGAARILDLADGELRLGAEVPPPR
jgi:broad specificity phosphatase PhoE